MNNSVEIYKCSWCKRDGDISLFGMMKKDQRYKLCYRCRENKSESILETIHEFCATRELECLSIEYKSTGVKMDWHCLRCDNKFSASYASVKNSKYCGKCKKKTKYSIEYIEELCKDTNVQCLSTEYKNTDTLMEWNCIKCGYAWEEYMKNMRNPKCDKCEKQKKMNIETVRENALAIGFKLIDEKYTISTKTYKWQCIDCGNICITAYNNLIRKKGCGKCIYNQERYTLERVKEISETKCVECLSTEYIHCNSPMKWKCKKCNREWITTWRSLKQNIGCIKCTFKEKITLNMDIVKEEIKDRNIECLSTEYITAIHRMKWRCLECNYIWEIDFHHIRHSKSGCPNCASYKSERMSRKIIEELTGLSFPKVRMKKLQYLELDGYNKEIGLAFEYDGKQHTEYIEYFHKTEDGFHDLVRRDILKEELCYINNIILLRIPHQYDHRNPKALRRYIKRQLLEIYCLDDL